MPGSTAKLSQGHLELLGVGYCPAIEQFVDRGVVGQERQPVEGFEAAERQAASLSEPVGAERGFMHQLQCQPRSRALRRLPGPRAQQVPGSQTQVLRDQQPQAQGVVVDLIGEPLSNSALKAERIAVDVTHHVVAEPRFELLSHLARTTPVEFFLQAVVGQHAFHAADADGPAALNQLLRNHFRRCIGIEKAVTNHLPHEFGRAAVVRLGAAFLTLQGDRAPLGEGGAELEVALLAVAELLRGAHRAGAVALALDEHRELPRNLIVGGHFQRAMIPDQGVLSDIEIRPQNVVVFGQQARKGAPC